MLSILICSALAGCSAQADLGLLGEVSPLRDLRPPERNRPVSLMISECGRRVFALSPERPLVTWDTNSLSVKTIIFGVAAAESVSDVTLWWREFEGEAPYAPGLRVLAGVLDEHRPLVWRGFGGDRSPAALAWLDVRQEPDSGGRVSNGGRLLFFNGESYSFLDYNHDHKILLVATGGPKGSLRAFRIGDDHRAAKEVPLPPGLHRLPPISFTRLLSRSWRYAVLDNREIELESGKETRRFSEPRRNRIYRYVGDDLFFMDEQVVRDDEPLRLPQYMLWFCDRKSGQERQVGPYRIVGDSPSGKLLILEGRGKGERHAGALWLVSRTAQTQSSLDRRRTK
jgi:hypothetical protein